jgi:hypothetical protein
MGSLKARAGAAAAAIALLVLAGCARQDDTMSWAKAALSRNDRLEIVAVDPQNRTFTVRMKDSGELRMIKADDVMGAPAPAASTTAAGATQPAPAAAGSSGANAAAVAPPEEAFPKPAAPATAAAPAGPGVEPAVPETPAAPALGMAPRGANASPSGQVLESGPGYSIEAGARAVIPVSNIRTGDAGVTSAPLERRHEPIVCQGSRMLHIDNRNLEFDGDAVSAENGCELYITNSHITATGTGISVSNANVHIDNSLIEGDAASLDAQDGGQIYAESSRFHGMSRQLDTAAVHDLGGNVWD